MGGGKGGGSSVQTIKENADPWKGIQPYLIGGSVTTPSGTSTTNVTLWYNPTTGQYQSQAPIGKGMSSILSKWFPEGSSTGITDLEGNTWVPVSQTLSVPQYQTQDIVGIYPEAMKTYLQSQTNLASITPLLSEYTQQILQDMQSYRDVSSQLRNIATNLIGGATSMTNLPYTTSQQVPTSFAPLSITAPPPISAPTVSAPQVNYNQVLSSLGVLNPTQTFQELMRGDINPFLTQAEEAITQNVTRNTMENVLPNIASEAFASGAYGGSRQGIAEGLAISRLQQDIAQPLAQLRYNTWQTAQELKSNISQFISNQALMTALENAKMKLQANLQSAALQQDAAKFNATLAMQEQINNAQTALQQQQMGLQAGIANMQSNLQSQLANLDAYLKASQLGLQQTLAGTQILPSTIQNLSPYYSTLLQLTTTPNEMLWQNMARYASLIQPGAGIGGTSTKTSEVPYYTNPMAGMMGGALLGASLVPTLFEGVSALGGAGIGAGIGLLGSLFR